MEIPVLDKGFVRLDGHMADDLSVVNSARVSFAQRQEEMDEKGAGLIRYLMRGKHGTPFEHNCMRFHVKVPLFVVREWHRHRIGWCLAGDTEITFVNPGDGENLRRKSIAEVWRNWHEGVSDSMGRTRKLESCRNLTVRVLDENTGVFKKARVLDVMKSGEKFLWRITLADGKMLEASKDHRVFTTDGWKRIEELGQGAANAEVIVTGGRAHPRAEALYPPALRRGIGVWTSMQRDRLIEEQATCYSCQRLFDRDELHLDHLVPVVADLKLALDTDNLVPMCHPCHRAKTNSEQALATRLGIIPVGTPSRVVSIESDVRVEETYDLSVEGPWHNFLANGMVVHNSYNEWSGRYSKLEPEWYVPHRDNVRHQVGKPGAYTFERIDDDDYAEAIRQQVDVAADYAFSAYNQMLNGGIAKEVARLVLPVNTYTQMYATCNARSLMAFLELRNSPHAQWEIRQYAIAMEEIFAQLMPQTYESFIHCERVAP